MCQIRQRSASSAHVRPDLSCWEPPPCHDRIEPTHRARRGHRTGPDNGAGRSVHDATKAMTQFEPVPRVDCAVDSFCSGT